ncbi:MAG TPA: hypothetical protein VE957_04750 [Terriglobales bacterium]|nr:hypothetical protein [Terriglobales bacterium]
MKSADEPPGLGFRPRAHAGWESAAAKVVPESSPAKVGMGSAEFITKTV